MTTLQINRGVKSGKSKHSINLKEFKKQSMQLNLCLEGYIWLEIHILEKKKRCKKQWAKHPFQEFRKNPTTKHREEGNKV